MQKSDSQKHAGKSLGLSLIISGIILGVINHLLLYYANLTIMLLCSYTIFITIGLSFMLFPGNYKGELKTFDEIIEFFKQTSRLHGTIWVIGLILGVIGLLVQIVYYGLY